MRESILPNQDARSALPLAFPCLALAGNRSDQPVRWTPLLEQGESEKSQGVWGTASPSGCVAAHGAKPGAAQHRWESISKRWSFPFPAYRPCGKRKRERLDFCRLAEG